MMRVLLYLALALSPLFMRMLPAQADDGPPISITSPDPATTFAYGAVKNHALIWNKAQKMLIAQVTFTDAELNNGQTNDDSHEFRLPGVTFDPAKNIFFATTAKGETIPVAHYKKVLFFNTIEVLPNAHVTILHPRGVVTVILEAISPNDPAMHPAPTDPDATHRTDLDKILN
jgi:hypothetical protein